MSSRGLAPTDDDLAEITAAVTRLVRARVADPQHVADLVQETLTRLLATGDRLGEAARLPFALVTARNLVADEARARDRHRRHAPRLLDPREPDRPEDVVLHGEQAAAVSAALDALPAADRELMVAYSVDGAEAAELAAARCSSAGAVTAQLARTRARLRVDYLLALRRAELPTGHCRPILLALSAGDHRRQHRLAAGAHLLSCRTCAELSKPLLARRSALAALTPWWLLGGLGGRLHRMIRTRNARLTVAGLTTAAGLAAVLVAVFGGGGHAPTIATPTAGATAAPGGRAGQPGGIGDTASPTAAPTSASGSTVATVLFASGSASLDSPSRLVIVRTAQLIRARRPAAVTVIGFTDTEGNLAVNEALSRQRAQAVLAALEAAVNDPAIHYQLAARAAADPVADNSSGRGRRLNRRVTITVRLTLPPASAGRRTHR